MKNRLALRNKLYIFVMILAVCFACKVISCAIPGDNILSHIKQSCIGDRVGENLGRLPISLSSNTWLDFSSESDYLSTVVMTDRTHPVKSAVCNYVPVRSSDSPYEAGAGRLAELLLDQKPEVDERPVYWWGITSILRPLLCIMTYDQVMTLIQLIAMLSWMGAILNLYKAGGIFPAISFAFSALLVNHHIGLMQLCTSMPFIIAYTHIIVVIHIKKRTVAINSMMVNGMFTAYLDWMSTPIIAFAYPVMAALIRDNKSVYTRYFFL